jgi:hypothetical protein
MDIDDSYTGDNDSESLKTKVAGKDCISTKFQLNENERLNGVIKVVINVVLGGARIAFIKIKFYTFE